LCFGESSPVHGISPDRPYAFQLYMAQTCVIFDIDGTLIDSNDFDSRLYTAAVRRVLGNDVFIRPSWIDYTHVTDSGILRQLCADNGVDPTSCEQRVRTRFGEMVSEYLRSSGACDPIPGALALLTRLCSNSEFQVGIATGGWGHTARLKLASAGYSLPGVPLKSSDDHQERTGIMTLCRNELAPEGHTVYVGDAEWDLQAAAKLGWGFVGVGQALRGRCTRWTEDFASEDALQCFTAELV